MSDPRHYSVRPEWVWSAANPELSKTAKLEVSLSAVNGQILQQSFEQWLAQWPAIHAETETYSMGGCGLKLLAKSDNEIQILLFSGGQDALESLDDLVQNLYEGLIRDNKSIEVRWTELPIQ